MLNSLVRKVAAVAVQLRHVQFVINAPAESVDLPDSDNVLFVSNVPQMKILDRASVMVNHAGFGSIKQCVHQGVPMLLIPQEWDQPLNADRVVHHGFGIAFPNEDAATPQAIKDALLRLLADNSYRDSALRMKDVFLACERASLAARACEDLMSVRKVSGISL